MRRTQKDKKSTNEKCLVAWEWGTNEYFYLPCVTILWCLSWKLPKDKFKMKSAYLSLKRVILNLRFWFPFPKVWTIINDYKYIYVTLWESRHLEEFSVSVPLLNSLLLKEEFIQRSGFTSELPIVAAATFSKFLEILDPPFLLCLPHSATCLDYLRPISCYSIFRLGPCMFWTVRLSNFPLFIVEFKVEFSFAIFGGQPAFYYWKIDLAFWVFRKEL